MNLLYSIIFFSAALFSSATFAQAIPAPTAFDRFMEQATGAGKQTVQFGRTGVPTTAPGVPTVNTDGGLPRVDATGSVRNPSGNPVPVSGTGRIPAAEVSKAVGRGIKNIAGKALVVVGVGVAIYDMAAEINYILKRKPDGSIGVDKKDTELCTVAPCYEYNAGGIWTAPGSAACKLRMQQMTSGDATFIYNYTSAVAGSSAVTCYGTTTRKDNGTAGTLSPFNLTARVGTPFLTNVVTSTEQEFLDAVAAKSGWPAGSAVRRVIAEDNAPDGEKIQIGTPTVTGPATSTGTTTTTNNTTNNTTTTETTTHNHTYAGPVITTTNTTINTTVNNSTGGTTNSTTTTSTPVSPAPAAEPQKIDVCGLPNTPACKIDETGTSVYDPDKLKLDKPKLDADAAAQRDTIKGTADKGMFSSWSAFFTLPALRACEPVDMPSYMGQQLGSMNVCPGAEWLRGLMGFIWAAAGFVFCFRTVSGVI